MNIHDIITTLIQASLFLTLTIGLFTTLNVKS